MAATASDVYNPGVHRGNVVSSLPGNEVRALAAREGQNLVSIYLSAHRTYPDSRFDPVKLKGLLKQARELLEREGVRPDKAQELLEPARRLELEPTVWEHSAGLAIFLAPGFFRYLQLPLTFEEMVTVGPRFHLAPLVPLLTSHGRFAVLALSKDQVRLLQCTPFGQSETRIADMPKSLQEALSYDQTSSPVHFHAMKSGGTAGRGTAMFHGVGSDWTKEMKEYSRHYLERVDAALGEALKRDARVPLVLAGVDYLLATYREVSRYPDLVAQSIVGNPELLHDSELRERAWEIVRPIFDAARRQAVERYRETAGTGLTSDTIEEILLASHDGRVRTLFITAGAHQWGIFERETRRVELYDEFRPGREELIDTAALQTFLSEGETYMVKPEDMPAAGPVAAIFRY